MLVEINLLPQKETKNKSLLLLAIIAVVLLLSGGFFAFWLNHMTEKDLAFLDQQISTAEQLISIEQDKLVAYDSSQSAVELEKTVEWASDYPLKTVPLLQKLTALLPERGFIQTFSYDEAGHVDVTIQFESNREAAFYLNALLETDWVAEANITNLVAVTQFYDKTTEQETMDNRLKNEKYVPRYVGEYEITFNRSVLQAESSEGTGGDAQ